MVAVNDKALGSCHMASLPVAEKGWHAGPPRTIFTAGSEFQSTWARHTRLSHMIAHAGRADACDSRVDATGRRNTDLRKESRRPSIEQERTISNPKDLANVHRNADGIPDLKGQCSLPNPNDLTNVHGNVNALLGAMVPEACPDLVAQALHVLEANLPISRVERVQFTQRRIRPSKQKSGCRGVVRLTLRGRAPSAHDRTHVNTRANAQHRHIHKNTRAHTHSHMQIQTYTRALRYTTALPLWRNKSTSRQRGFAVQSV